MSQKQDAATSTLELPATSTRGVRRKRGVRYAVLASTLAMEIAAGATVQL